MSGAIVQMAASHASNEYQVPGGIELTQPAGGNTASVPLPLVQGGRRKTSKKARRTRHRRVRRHHRTHRK